MFNNMQSKLALLFFIFALAPLSAVGFFSIRTAEETILSMAANQLEQIAADKASLLGRWIAERKADVEVMAHSSMVKTMDGEQMASYLELVRNRYGEYDDISVMTIDGRWVHGSSGTGFRIEDDTWLREAASGRLYVSEMLLNAEKGESFFRIAAPVAGPWGEVSGIVCADVGARTILSVILQVSLGETGECYLVSLDGTFLAHKEPGRILSQNIAQSDSFKNISHVPGSRITYIDYRGIEVLGASRRVPGTDWALVVEQDRDEAFRGADRLRRYILVALALSTAGALLFAWLISRYVALPIRGLAQAAHQLAGGDFDGIELFTNRTDEIGQLHTAFGEMAGQLRDRQDSLEKKVIRREEELKRSDVRLKQTQEAVVRSQQLAALGQLAAGVAHEIRTPLTSLKMFLESMESEMEPSAEYEEDFLVAMNQMKRMEDTINRFLNFARPQEPIMMDMDVKELIEDALLMMGPRARQQETLISVNLDRDMPPIRGDAKQLGEALLNLMVNALEAMGTGGELTIEAGLALLDTDGEERSFVRIDVRDTGPGIREDCLPRIFEPFFTTRANGTGLGLSIVRGAIEGHGGKIEANSRAGDGATFSVFLPVSGAPGPYPPIISRERIA